MLEFRFGVCAGTAPLFHAHEVYRFDTPQALLASPDYDIMQDVVKLLMMPKHLIPDQIKICNYIEEKSMVALQNKLSTLVLIRFLLI